MPINSESDSYFDTVEINNSFYRLPSGDALRGWRDSTPPGFLFAIKASRYIPHNKKLSGPESALERFFPKAELLGRKLGPILFQLPPSWKVNGERLELFLGMLPKGRRYAFELRNPTWNTKAVYEI